MCACSSVGWVGASCSRSAAHAITAAVRSIEPSTASPEAVDHGAASSSPSPVADARSNSAKSDWSLAFSSGSARSASHTASGRREPVAQERSGSGAYSGRRAGFGWRSSAVRVRGGC
eukprot:3239403-Prymnesium_polylepis.1